MSRETRVPPTLRWRGSVSGWLEILDQRALPLRERTLRLRSAPEVWDAIRTLAVRGAPAIGIAGAYGLALALRRTRGRDFHEESRRAADYLRSARPTAANLGWALDRMLRSIRGAAGKKTTSGNLLQRLLREARAIHREDARSCRRIGELGAALLPRKATVLTHCNAGSLATGGEGTALAVVYRAAAAGKRIRVFAGETRPLLQGARLTCWELARRGIETTLLADGAAASLVRSGAVDAVVVGADRIAANGDTANKVGTYPLALLCREHGVPFYVAAPLSTFDLSLRDGRGIPIESRPPEEVSSPFGSPIAPEEVSVYNPAFDVTPARLVTALVTDAGVVRNPSREKIQKLFRKTADKGAGRSRRR